MDFILSLPRLLASRWLTIVLMAVAAAAMAAITVFEAVAGTGETPFPLYGSWWFTGLLWLVWVNLAFNAFQRSWWKWKKLPGILAHAGFLLILTGGYLTGALGIRGDLSISEGETAAAFRVETPVLRAAGRGERWEEVFTLASSGAFRPNSLLAALNPFRSGDRAALADGTPIAILGRTPSSRTSAELVAVPAGEGRPGVILSLVADDPGLSRQIMLQDGDRGRVAIPGLASIAYRHALEMEEAKDAAAEVFSERIEIQPPNGEPVSLPVSLPREVGQTLSAGPYRVEILEYHPNFKMGRTPLPEDEPINPAVRLAVSGPGGEKTLYSFAYLEFHGNRLEDGTAVLYRRPAGQALLVVTRAGAAVEFSAVRGAGEEPVPFSAEHPLVVGTPSSSASLAPVRFIPSSEFVERIVPLDRGVGDPAFLVQVGGDGEPQWISQKGGAAQSADGLVEVALGAALPMGFHLTLDDAVAKYWPASNIPRAFYSLVSVDGRSGSPYAARIETNHPFLNEGFRLYQSGMDQEPPYRWSVFSVTRDPGLPAVTAGFLIMTAGLLWLFWSRFVVKPIKGQAGEGGGEP